ncbi:MAG: cation diffusion facilitator family transporter [Gemmatimonadota bacterium]
MRSVLFRVLLLNLLVVAMKVVAFASANALSVVAEAVHSSLDASNNVFALWIARVAGREPDEDHPYGHHKFETLGALALVGFLSITVFELVQHSVLRLLGLRSAHVEATPLALGIMAVSAAVGLLVSRYEAGRGRALNSDILLADAAHTRSDVYTTLAVLAGLGVVRLGHPVVDPLITLVVAAIVAWTGWRIVRGAVPVLVDERAVSSERIRGVAEDTEGVASCYGIRSRGRRGEIFAELTISVDRDLDVLSSHAIADTVEERVMREIHAREVVVHVEPAE